MSINLPFTPYLYKPGCKLVCSCDMSMPGPKQADTVGNNGVYLNVAYIKVYNTLFIVLMSSEQ